MAPSAPRRRAEIILACVNFVAILSRSIALALLHIAAGRPFSNSLRTNQVFRRDKL
jgi:hypothetical protein